MVGVLAGELADQLLPAPRWLHHADQLAPLPTRDVRDSAASPTAANRRHDRVASRIHLVASTPNAESGSRPKFAPAATRPAESPKRKPSGSTPAAGPGSQGSPGVRRRRQAPASPQHGVQPLDCCSGRSAVESRTLTSGDRARATQPFRKFRDRGPAAGVQERKPGCHGLLILHRCGGSRLATPDVDCSASCRTDDVRGINQ
jgi:hypothetical protein